MNLQSHHNNGSRAIYAGLLGISAVVLLLCLIEAFRSAPVVTGDGPEYLACTYNLARGHGFDLVEVPKEAADYLNPILNKLRQGEGLVVGNWQHWQGLIRDSGGRIVSWHWCGYSAFAWPAHAVLNLLQLDTRLAFTATNFMFLGLLLGYLAWFCRQPPVFRAMFACLFLLSGTSFYLWWTHPEVMAASLLAIGLLAWLDKRPAWSCLSIALAATQNPPIALMLAFPLQSALAALAQQVRSGTPWREQAKALAASLAASLIVVIPSAWFMHRLGVVNPIVAGGAAIPSTQNFLKSLDLFFDLNQGMVLVQLVTMLFLVVYAVFSVVPLRSKSIESKRTFARMGWLLLASYVMALAAASAVNWNPGVSVISRYAYWLSIPVILAACLAVQSMGSGRAAQGAIVAMTAGGVLLVSLWGLHGKTVSSERLTTVSQWAIKTFPSYFPHPLVFCTRVLGKECTPDRVYTFRDDAKNPTRVMVVKETAARLCQGPLPVEPIVRRETYLVYDILWYRGPATCPSGLRLDGLSP